ncbi:hypothetical protein ACIBF5_29685 [Micromonospora sp. NPDC050417]|uniref:hypothetical protein n=1 Tax=Micromonospora sp. NPDC050417 TaxID=3364280 RepID=UPI0037909DF2
MTRLPVAESTQRVPGIQARLLHRSRPGLPLLSRTRRTTTQDTRSVRQAARPGPIRVLSYPSRQLRSFALGVGHVRRPVSEPQRVARSPARVIQPITTANHVRGTTSRHSQHHGTNHHWHNPTSYPTAITVRTYIPHTSNHLASVDGSCNSVTHQPDIQPYPTRRPS